jgi:hypothetical protein
MDSKGDPDQRIAACSAQLANPLQFGWTCNSFVQGQLQTKPCDEKGLSGIRGLLFNARGSAYKKKGDLKSAIADFQQAVASARFAGESRPGFERNLQQAQAESAEYDQQYDQFVQQWRGCFSSAESATEANRNILMCDFALSFPRIVPVDRDKLIQQRATLEGIKAQLQQQQQQRPPQGQPVRGDEAPVTEVTEGPESGAGGRDFGWLGPVFRFIQVNLVFGWTAAVVVTGLFIWLFVSVASSTPVPILKHRAVIVGWITIPAVLAGVLFFWGPFLTSFVPYFYFELFISIFCIIWTDVFTALVVGGIIKQRFSERPPPAAPSLPFVALAFTALTFAAALLFVNYGHVVEPVSCTGDDPFPNLCWFQKRDGFYFATLVLICVIVCGVMLPADSNLVFAYERVNRWVRSCFADWAAGWREGRRRREEAGAVKTGSRGTTAGAEPARPDSSPSRSPESTEEQSTAPNPASSGSHAMRSNAPCTVDVIPTEAFSIGSLAMSKLETTNTAEPAMADRDPAAAPTDSGEQRDTVLSELEELARSLSQRT